MKFGIRLLYLYLFAFVGLMTTIIGSVQLVDLGLKSYVFKVSEYSYYPETPAVDGKPVLSLEEVKKRNEKEQTEDDKEGKQKEIQITYGWLVCWYFSTEYT